MLARLGMFAAATALALSMVASAHSIEPGVCLLGPVEHSGGLNNCGCHFNHLTGECHCHQPRGCGCECQPATCPR